MNPVPPAIVLRHRLARNSAALKEVATTRHARVRDVRRHGRRQRDMPARSEPYRSECRQGWDVYWLRH